MAAAAFKTLFALLLYWTYGGGVESTGVESKDACFFPHGNYRFDWSRLIHKVFQGDWYIKTEYGASTTYRNPFNCGKFSFKTIPETIHMNFTFLVTDQGYSAPEQTDFEIHARENKIFDITSDRSDLKRDRYIIDTDYDTYIILYECHMSSSPPLSYRKPKKYDLMLVLTRDRFGKIDNKFLKQKLSNLGYNAKKLKNKNKPHQGIAC